MLTRFGANRFLVGLSCLSTLAVGADASAPVLRDNLQNRDRNLVVPCSLAAKAGNWSLQGTLVTPDQVIDQGLVAIAGNKIAAIKRVGDERSPCPRKIDGIILPGLIDLHNHLTWNVLPRWHPPKQYSNRYEWQHESPEYKEHLLEPHDYLLSGPYSLGCQANLYAEVKALVGGATSIVGSHEKPCVAGLVRDLDYDSGLHAATTGSLRAVKSAQISPVPLAACPTLAPGDRPIVDVAVNEVFPLKLSRRRVGYLRCHLKNSSLRSLLVHVAEGKPTDPPSREEFGKIQRLGLLRDGLAIVHGTALQPDDLAAVKSSGAGLVWSPRSEIELYGATLNVTAAKSVGVAMAIAPDWSPTGSDGMLQELKYARIHFGEFDAKQLTAMATAIPAKLARIDDRIGQLKAGLYADLLVIRRTVGSPYDSVAAASPADVELVVIGGRPVYGDRALMEQLVPDKKLVLMTICGATKAIDLDGTLAAQSSWEAIKAALQERLRHGEYPTHLSALGCGASKSDFRAKRQNSGRARVPMR